MENQQDVISTMLSLAAVTYRGINLIAPEPRKSLRLRALMEECIGRISVLENKWKIVWGPASFSAASPGLDDAAMYVAECVDNPSKLVIAIRGTNPLSIQDWIFGDLMVSHQVDWPYGDPAATEGSKISASSAYGLGILQHLRWNATATGVAPSAAALEPPAQSNSLEDLIHTVRLRLSSLAAAATGQTFEAQVKELGAAKNFDPLALLKQTDADAGAGISLKQFLRSRAAAKLDVSVTGHSKGGALCSTVALWLADTQGAQTQASEEWDRNRNATIQYYSFAGPTAGNDVFAKHSDAVLNKNCCRVWNDHDIVPRAFLPDKLKEISALYELKGLEEKVVAELVDRVSKDVKDLNYRQVCGTSTELKCQLIPSTPFPLQIIHQHLDSYLQHYGLDDISAATLLAPVV